MMDTDERIARSHQANAEWRQVGFAFDAVEKRLLEVLVETPVGQEAKVLNLHKAVQNLAAVRQAIMQVIQDGNVAEAELAARRAVTDAGFSRPY